MAEYRKVTCILCPNACQLGVHFDKKRKKIIDLENSQCKRGMKYAMEEIFDSKRSVMTVVPIESKFWKVTSVITAEPIPKNKIIDVYDEIKKIRLKAPVKNGDVLIHNVCNLNVDVIITRTVIE